MIFKKYKKIQVRYPTLIIEFSSLRNTQTHVLRNRNEHAINPVHVKAKL